MEQRPLPLQTPELRPYQQQVIRELYAHICNGVKRLLLFAPTGAGKTVLASQVIADASSRGKPVLFLMHRDILVAQSAAKLRQFGVSCGFIKSGWQENRSSRVQIASVQTLLARDWWLYRGNKVLKWGINFLSGEYPFFITLGRGKALESYMREPSWKLVNLFNQAYKATL